MSVSTPLNILPYQFVNNYWHASTNIWLPQFHKLLQAKINFQLINVIHEASACGHLNMDSRCQVWAAYRSTMTLVLSDNIVPKRKTLRFCFLRIKLRMMNIECWWSNFHKLILAIVLYEHHISFSVGICIRKDVPIAFDNVRAFCHEPLRKPVSTHAYHSVQTRGNLQWTCFTKYQT